MGVLARTSCTVSSPRISVMHDSSNRPLELQYPTAPVSIGCIQMHVPECSKTPKYGMIVCLGRVMHPCFLVGGSANQAAPALSRPGPNWSLDTLPRVCGTACRSDVHRDGVDSSWNGRDIQCQMLAFTCFCFVVVWGIYFDKRKLPPARLVTSRFPCDRRFPRKSEASII